jgi:hypothetical protein
MMTRTVGAGRPIGEHTESNSTLFPRRQHGQAGLPRPLPVRCGSHSLPRLRSQRLLQARMARGEIRPGN